MEIPNRAAVASVADDLVRFWSTVPLYRTLNTSPELRLEIGVLLRDNGGLQHTLWPQFPREADVLIDARFLYFATLDDRLQVRAPLGLASAERLRRWANGPAVRNTAVMAVKASTVDVTLGAQRACRGERWCALVTYWLVPVYRPQ